jgi:hypothetical protein
MISITVNGTGHQLDIEDAATVGHPRRRYGLPMQPVIVADEPTRRLGPEERLEELRTSGVLGRRSRHLVMPLQNNSAQNLYCCPHEHQTVDVSLDCEKTLSA